VRLHYRLGWIVALGLARLLWRLRADGREHIPETGRAIVASNHISNWDPILVGLTIPREVHFLAKEELFRNRPLRWLISAYNAVPVRRGTADRRALRLAADVLRRNGVLLMFPEGTRSVTGEIGKGKPGVGFLACSTGAPIVPACIVGSDTLGRAFRKRRPVSVRFGPAIAPPESATNETYRSLTARVMAEIRQLRAEADNE